MVKACVRLIGNLKKSFSGKTHQKNDDILSPSKILGNFYSQINTPVYLINRDYEVIWGNTSFFQLQFPNDANKCYEIFCGFSQPCPNCMIQTVIEKEIPKEWITTRLHIGTTSKIWKISSTPIKVDSYTNALCFATLIAQLPNNSILQSKYGKEIEEDKFLEILGYINYAAILLDSDLNILNANQTAIELFSKDGNNSAMLSNIFQNFPSYPPANLLNAITSKPRNSFELKENENSFIVHSFSLLNNFSNNTNYLLLFQKVPEQTKGDELLWKFFSENSEKLTEAIFAIDSVGILRFANSSGLELLNLDKDAINSSILNKIPTIFLEKVLIFEDTNHFIYENTDKEKNKRLFKVYSLKFTNFENGNPIAIFIAKEVTEFINIQSELEKIKSLLSLFSKKFNGIIIRYSTDFNITEIFGNPEKIISHKTEHLIKGKYRWLDFIYSEDKKKVEEIYSEAKYFPNYQKTFEYRLVNKNTTIWVEEHLENVTDERGKIIFLQSIIYENTQRKLVEEQLKNSQEEMRNLALYFESLREEEKKKLAFEIHDELGHVLTAMKLELSWLIKKQFLRQEVLHERLRKTIDLIETTLRKVRSLSSQLRPSVLDHFGIVAAIEWQGLEFQKQTSIRCRLFLTKEEIKLQEQKAIAIFRIFQEILTNVARHSNATRVDVHLQTDGNFLILTVSDNGKGIKTEQINTKHSLGIISMKERANAINGKVQIHGIANIGTTVTLTVPIN